MKSEKHYATRNMRLDGPRIRVTLNIPRSLRMAIETQLKRRNMSMAEFLHFLLARYGKLLSSQYCRDFLPSSKGILIRYQERGQNLEQETARVMPEDWMELAAIAVDINASRSLIFVHCVRLLLYGASKILKTAQMQRAYWHALAKKRRIVRLEVSIHVDREGLLVRRKHKWEFGKEPDLIGKI